MENVGWKVKIWKQKEKSQQNRAVKIKEEKKSFFNKTFPFRAQCLLKINRPKEITNFFLLSYTS